MQLFLDKRLPHGVQQTVTLDLISATPAGAARIHVLMVCFKGKMSWHTAHAAPHLCSLWHQETQRVGMLCMQLAY